MKNYKKKFKQYVKINETILNLLQKDDLIKKVEICQLKKLKQKIKTVYKNG